MNQHEVETLADKVTKKKHELREALLRKKCSAKGKLESRIVLTREISLSADEKRNVTREAFNLTLGNINSLEDKLLLERAIGKELNKRKQQRKESSQACLTSAVAKLEKKEQSQDSLLEEIAQLEDKLRREEEYRRAEELLIQAGRAMRTEQGDLMIFNASNDE